VNVFKVAFPDLTGEVVRLITSEQEAAAEIVWTGTHTGPLVTPTGTIPPTGKPITVHATKVFVFAGDRIAYSRHYWDMTELLGAIGAMPGAG
jgi:predicted ester cyclase